MDLVDLFPASAAAATPAQAGSDAAREREPTSSRPRPMTFDRVLLAVAVGGSLVMGYKVGAERAARAGRSSLLAPELTGKGMPAPSWQSHVPRANRNAVPVAKAPAPAPAAETDEEPTPSVPPPTMSLVEAMAAAVKAKP
ncbi:MAG TPA: hypothetical protein VM694_28410 [Polyangium sp.]|nr:hypothetical protein [Polyangium sp.]